MSKGIDWASAPEGYPLWIEPTKPYEENEAGWHQEAGAVYRDTAGQAWGKESEDIAFVVHRKPDAPIAWGGEGLPPVGLLIEMLHVGCRKWQEITPLHIGAKLMLFERYAGEEVIEEVLPLSAIQLRPIRTAEQIAEDERSDFASALVKDLNIPPANEFNFYYELGERLHKLGYRKQVAP